MFRKLLPLLLVVAALAALVISPSPDPLAAQGGTAVLIANLNVRVGPDATEGVIATLPRGTVVTLQGRNRIGDWVYISTPTLNGGWVASRFLDWDDSVDLGSLPIVNATGQGAGAGGTLGFSGAMVQTPNAWPVQQMNLRQGPDTSYDSLGLIPAGTPLVVEGRSPDGVWALVVSPDNAWSGWVAAGFLSLSVNLDFDALPVTTALAQPPAAAAPPEDVIPEGEEDAHIQLLIDRLASVPVVPAVTQRARAIFAIGQGMGNRANVFAKIGDCHTDTVGFLFGFGQSDYNLGGYGDLQAAIDFFSASPRAGVPNSFVNWSAAANSAFTAEGVLNDVWSDPTICQPGETPLVCEYRLIQPALALILLGSVDAQIVDPLTFEFHLHAVVQQSIDRGVIPVLSTIPAHPEYFWERTLEYNRIILDLAERENLPVINYWLALRPLPNYGLGPDNFHLSQSGACTHFTGEEANYGLVVRNLITLQTLDRFRQDLLQ